MHAVRDSRRETLLRRGTDNQRWLSNPCLRDGAKDRQVFECAFIRSDVAVLRARAAGTTARQREKIERFEQGSGNFDAQD